MPVDLQTLFLTFPYVTAVLAINVLLLAVFILFGFYLLKRIALSHQESERLRSEAERKAQSIIENANTEAVKIIAGANEKSSKLFESTQNLINQSEAGFKKNLLEFIAKHTSELERVSGELLKSYRSLGDASKESFSKILEGAAKIMVESTRDSSSEFQKFLKEEIEKYRKDTDERITAWHKEAREEIEGYKKSAKDKIDESIYRIITLVSKEVLGRALDLEDHQKLILEALEGAKKEGFFKVSL